MVRGNASHVFLKIAMIAIKKYGILFLWFMHGSCLAQEENAYTKVDNFVESLEIRTRKVEKIAHLLTQPFEGNDSLKARAIFKWIAQTIEYDCKEYKRIMKNKREKPHKQKPKVVLRRKKAVCQGYSQLYEAIGKASGLDVVVISGLAKSQAKDIGNLGKRNKHAWNAVKINGQWRLLDATWASGSVRKIDVGKYRTKEKYFFVRDYIDYYFFPNPAQFIVNHFPNKNEWQLLPTPIERGTFVYYPIPHEAFFRQKFTFIGNSAYGIWKVSEDTPFYMDFQNDLRRKQYHTYTSLTQTIQRDNGAYIEIEKIHFN